MTMTAHAQALIDVAHGHLDAAADSAQWATRDAVTGSAFAAQIRLAAAGLPEAAPDEVDVSPLPGADVVTHLRLALAALDEIPPLDGPPDLPLCAWHVHELFRITGRVGAA